MSRLKATIRVSNEVDALVSGLLPHHNKSLEDKFAPFVPGYRFMPKFQLGQWDGRVRYFSKRGETYVNLLEEIINELNNWNYDISLDDRRSTAVLPNIELIDDTIFDYVKHPDSGDPLILRHYQVTMVNELIKAGGGIGVASTGAGKTLICAAMSKQFGEAGLRTLVIVPDGVLVKQTKDDYILVGLDVGEYAGKLKESEKTHVIATWQSLIRNPHIMKLFEVVIVDEAHKGSSASIKTLMTEYGGHILFRYGVTGTMPKDAASKMALKATIGERISYSVTAKDLMDEGFLAKLNIEVLVLEEDLKDRYAEYLKGLGGSTRKRLTYKEYKHKFLPDYTSEKNYLGNKRNRIDYISDIVGGLTAEGNVLVLVNGIAFGRKLQKLLPGSFFVNGTDVKKIEDRRKIYELFDERDDLIVIATANVASTGLSINRIHNMVYIDIGKSFTRVIQSIGRSLRKGGGKTEATVYDIGSDLKYAETHSKDRIKFYKEAKYPYVVKKIDYNSEVF